MPALTIDIPTIPTRLLNKKEAARYCRINPARFSVLCPVRPFGIEKNRMVYDIQELNRWIDSLKSGKDSDSDEALIGKLA